MRQEMKTPMQEALETYEVMLSLHPEMAVSVRSVVADLKSHLEKEKEMMCEFAWEYERECRINLEHSIEKCWDKTFNTKEK